MVCSLHQRQQLPLCHSSTTLLLLQDDAHRQIVPRSLPNLLLQRLSPLLHGSAERTVSTSGRRVQDKGVHAGLEAPVVEQQHWRHPSGSTGSGKPRRKFHQTQSEFSSNSIYNMCEFTHMYMYMYIHRRSSLIPH